MILLMFVIGLLLIIGISRYNESEKLFWTLLVSFVGSFAAATAVCKYVENKKTNEIQVASHAPTQVLYSGSHRCCVLADPSITVTNEEKSSVPVSKDSAEVKLDIVRSRVCAPARDQPTTPFDTS